MKDTTAEVATLVRYQWRAYWRRFRRGANLSVSNQGIVLLVLGLVLIKYLQILRTVNVSLMQGKTSLLQSLLAGIFIAWLFPLASAASGTGSASRMLHLPLTLRQLFAVRMISLFFPPTSWMIAAGSLAICYPMLGAPNPVAGIIAVLLFIATARQVGLSIAHLASNAKWRRGFLIVTLVLMFASTFYYLRGCSARPHHLL